MRNAIFLLFSVISLFGDIEDHLKKATGKTDDCHMRNIDFIYMINLDERPEKFEDCRQALAPYGIVPYRFSAVNGWELPLEVVNDVGLKYQPWMIPGIKGSSFLPEDQRAASYEVMSEVRKTYFMDQFFLGSIGVVLSHVSVLQDAYDSGYETIWVMEDDIEVIRDPRLLSELIAQLDAIVGKEGWDVLFTDRDTKNQEGEYVPCIDFARRPDFMPQNPERFAEQIAIGPGLRRVGARYGAYSMLLRRSGVRKLLNFMKMHQVFLAYDMEFTLPNDIRLYTVLEDVVSTKPRALTDNGFPNYRKKNG